MKAKLMSAIQRGFTLIELMITLAVIAIVAGVAAPSFNEVIQDNRLTTSSNELLGSLAIARSEAIKRGEQVIICQSNGGASCGGTTNWHQGWVVYEDENSNGSLDSSEIIVVHAALDQSINASSTINSITYDSDGLATGINNELIFTFCDQRGDSDSQGIAVSISGRVRQATSGLASCP